MRSRPGKSSKMQKSNAASRPDGALFLMALNSLEVIGESKALGVNSMCVTPRIRSEFSYYLKNAKKKLSHIVLNHIYKMFSSGDINGFDDHGFTPLHYMALFDLHHVLAQFVAGGVSFKMVGDPHINVTALQLATYLYPQSRIRSLIVKATSNKNVRPISRRKQRIAVRLTKQQLKRKLKLCQTTQPREIMDVQKKKGEADLTAVSYRDEPVRFPDLMLLNRSCNIPAFITDKYASSILTNLYWMQLMDVKHLLDDQKSYRNAKKVFQMMRMSLTQPNDEQVVRRFMSFSSLVHTQFLLELHKTGPFLEQLTREIEQKKRRSSYELSELMESMRHVIQRLKWICLSCIAKVESIRPYQNMQQPATEKPSLMMVSRTQYVQQSRIRQRPLPKTRLQAVSRNPKGISHLRFSQKVSQSNEQLKSAR
mmetsp:Transcript_23347/g.37515  ORF Transcript_23347/g.37515 Transcript_23347/m.37515 type:complete len:424 (-) Transcript_23347:121-1392(-)